MTTSRHLVGGEDVGQVVLVGDSQCINKRVDRLRSEAHEKLKQHLDAVLSRRPTHDLAHHLIAKHLRGSQNLQIKSRYVRILLRFLESFASDLPIVGDN